MVPKTLETAVKEKSFVRSVRNSLQSFQCERAVVVERQVAQRHAALGGQHLPRDEVGMVLHLRQ
jgi:hypothetical protein